MVLTVSLAVQALASGFVVFLLGRALFGVAFGLVWTIGLALLSDSSTRKSTALGAAIAVSGLGHLLGPPYAGFTAEHVGLDAPFVGLALGALLVTAFIAVASPRPIGAERQAIRFAGALRAAHAHRQIRGALLVIATLGLVAGVVQVAVPMQLDRNGLSPGQIGLALGAGAVVWTAVSGQTAALGESVVRLGLVGALLAALAGASLIVVVTSATSALVVFVVLHAAFASPLSTMSYPLAGAGARAAGIPVAAVIGLTNTLWAVTAMSGPIVGAALSQSLGRASPFAMIVLLCAAVAAWSVHGRPGRTLGTP